ncbi:MAG: hypothetical protein ACOX83_00925 [Candidatus Spyradocola sp.]|jgi:hypothetical protein
MEPFALRVGNFSWINGEADDPEDGCLHGHAAARIAGETVEYDCTVSAAALYLLKSLTEDHVLGEGEQFFPCCGFFLVADAAGENVSIIGCDNGADWTVRHEGERVRLILPDGKEQIVPLEAYRAEVFAFADAVEAQYRACAPKILPEDEFDRRGYETFWKEWRRRRGK